MIKDLYDIARDAGLGFWGFVSLLLVIVIGLGLRRAAQFAKGLNGQWRALIDEGTRMRKQLHEELEDATNMRARHLTIIEQQRAELDTMRVELSRMSLQVMRLQEELHDARKHKSA